MGDPIKFPSKILALKVNTFLDPSGDVAFIAEAGGLVSSIRVSTNAVARTGIGGTAPVTCLTCYGGRDAAAGDVIVQHVFAGSWDKTITRFSFGQDPATKNAASAQNTFTAHTDFVKCLLVAQTGEKEPVLLSGGADGDICIWTLDGNRIAVMRPQSRGIECLTLDPYSSPDSPTVFFSTSQREIYGFNMPSIAAMRAQSPKWSQPILQHETSVYKLTFDNDGDLWTASADKTAKRLVRENNFAADTTLVHPDFVRDIVLYEPSGLAITACRDEAIRVWQTGTSQLLYTFSGHFEEVTGLDISGNTLLSVSIDATLRRWSLAPADLKKAIEAAKNPDLAMQDPEPPTTFGGLTAEEEAELQALMEEQEAESLERMARDEQ